jgi:hypothetical protein
MAAEAAEAGRRNPLLKVAQQVARGVLAPLWVGMVALQCAQLAVLAVAAAGGQQEEPQRIETQQMLQVARAVKLLH